MDTPKLDSPKPKFVINRTARLVAYIITVIIALIAALGITVTFGYQGSYYPGVSVGGVDVGGLSKSAGETKVKKMVSDASTRAIHISIPDPTAEKDALTGQYPEKVVETTVDKLDYTTTVDDALSSAWQVGHGSNSFAWLPEVVQSFFYGKRVPITATVAAEKVDSFVVTDVSGVSVKPAPAQIAVNGADVAITDEKPGVDVDINGLSKQIQNALTTVSTEPLAIRLPTSLSISPITSSVVKPVADQLVTLGNTNVTFTVDGITFKPSKADILQWFTVTQSDAGALALAPNSTSINAYLTKANKGIDLTKSTAVVVTSATAWLKSAKAADTVTLIAKVSPVAVPGQYKTGLYPGKYVYVNISEQKAYRINGDTLEKTYIVSTGKWSTPTPRGTFAVASKYPRAYSREFGLYMPWWQNFVGTSNDGEVLPTGSYGLHELPEWPNGYKEGQGHLGTPVSHGCVRFGIGDAKEIYDWTDIGTPVVIE